MAGALGEATGDIDLVEQVFDVGLELPLLPLMPLCLPAHVEHGVWLYPLAIRAGAFIHVIRDEADGEVDRWQVVACPQAEFVLRRIGESVAGGIGETVAAGILHPRIVVGVGQVEHSTVGHIGQKIQLHAHTANQILPL